MKRGRRRSSKGLAAFKEKYPKVYLIVIDSENYSEFEKDPMIFLDRATVF